MGLGELALGETADILIDVLSDGLTGSLGGFLNHQARVLLNSSD